MATFTRQFPLDSVATHLWRNVYVICALLLVDQLVVRPFVRSQGVSKRRDTRAARWFFVHSIGNFFVCAAAANSVISCFINPLHAADPGVMQDRSFFGNASPWPLTILNSLHAYHMVGGFDLTSADYFHHFLFVPTGGFTGQAFNWGALGNMLAVFISGFPGGVDYFMLGLQKCDLWEKMREKHVNANLNVWCRMPGIVACSVLLYVAWVEGLHDVPLWAILIQLSLPVYNGLYYGKQAIANYAVHYMLHLLGEDVVRDKIRERTSLTTGETIIAWKEHLAVPQRGS